MKIDLATKTDLHMVQAFSWVGVLPRTSRGGSGQRPSPWSARSRSCSQVHAELSMESRRPSSFRLSPSLSTAFDTLWVLQLQYIKGAFTHPELDSADNETTHAGSIFDNIAYGRHGRCTREEVEAAAR